MKKWSISLGIYQAAKTLSKKLPLGGGIAIESIPTTAYSSRKKRTPQGEHWAVVAPTGYGKTTFDRAILRMYRYLYPSLRTYILDSKKLNEFTPLDGKVIQSLDPPPPIHEGERQVWTPLEDNIDAYHTYCYRILSSGNPAIVLVDESKNLKFNGKGPKGYELLLAQGRVPGIHVITNYQEIADGLRQGLSQATHIIGFGAINPYDEQMLRRYLNMAKSDSFEELKRFSFYYMNRKMMARPRIFSHHREFTRWFIQQRKETS